MPRKGKGGGHGGVREGTPGTSHAQRSDLNSALPVQTAPSEGRDFGAVTRDRAAQQAVPMQGRPSSSAAVPNVPGPAPGELTPLNAPSQRPQEPITTGVDIGLGAGSEALMMNRQRGRVLLEEIAVASGDSFLMGLVQRAKGAL